MMSIITNEFDICVSNFSNVHIRNSAYTAEERNAAHEHDCPENSMDRT